jgi:ectoine hydroxylase-related dioxygenase (phytanoyl-CoA dioxygenase family)
MQFSGNIALMLPIPAQLEHYNNEGFVIVKGLFSKSSLDNVQSVLSIFHERWKEENKAFYEQQAINSAYLTDKNFLNNKQRTLLFKFISDPLLLEQVQKIIPSPAFLNTQLFFDPFNPQKKNYWHRDIQYDFSPEQQKSMLESNAELSMSMPHFRIPLVDEKGVEVIPKTHARWDTADEFDVRMENNGKHCYDNLPNSKVLSVKRGDLLIFSAKMLHRGVYGNNRFALDILFTDEDSSALKTVSTDCLPDQKLLKKIPAPLVFKRTLAARD